MERRPTSVFYHHISLTRLTVGEIGRSVQVLRDTDCRSRYRSPVPSTVAAERSVSGPARNRNAPCRSAMLASSWLRGTNDDL